MPSLRTDWRPMARFPLHVQHLKLSMNLILSNTTINAISKVKQVSLYNDPGTIHRALFATYGRKSRRGEMVARGLIARLRPRIEYNEFIREGSTPSSYFFLSLSKALFIRMDLNF